MKDHPDDHLAKQFGNMGTLDKIEWMIETHGWALETVTADPSTDPPTAACAYSIGMRAAVDFPDVAVFGLAPAAANGLVTLVADACRGGTAIPLGVELLGLLDNDLRCVFAPIDPAIAAQRFTTAVSWFGASSSTWSNCSTRTATVSFRTKPASISACEWHSQWSAMWRPDR